MDDIVEFFDQKKPWSKYKDLILEYYLEPYLYKVARLKKPILVVDCFAGPGKFEDGEDGSPLIISKKLQSLQDKGVDVKGIYIDSNPDLFERLRINLSNCPVPSSAYFGNFKEYIHEIADLAKTHTVFVYLDPIKPSDLLLNDLRSVYNQLHSGQSVETLINFMSRGFLRGILGGSERKKIENGLLNRDRPQVQTWNDIAGGTYWQSIAFDQSITNKEKVEQVAKGYINQLHTWFKWIISYPIREKYKHKFPKYHLIFGSRHTDGIELMNRAMVKARREFVGAAFVKGMLFENQPAEEVIDPIEIENVLIETLKKIGKTTWKKLRVYTTIANPCKYNDTDFNRAIKEAIKNNRINSDATGQKIEEDALIWPKEK